MSVPQKEEPQSAPKCEETQEPFRNSVSNAELIISTSGMQTAKKAMKEKAGSNHKAPVENP